MRAPRYLPFVLLTAFACKPADTTTGAKQAIDAANAQWPRLTSGGHADSIAEFYAVDAVLMPPNMATVRGRDAIRAFFTVMNTIPSPRPTDAPVVYITAWKWSSRSSWVIVVPMSTLPWKLNASCEAVFS